MSSIKHDTKHEGAIEEKPSERRRREKSERDPNRPRKHRPRVFDPETGEYVKAPSRRRKDKETDSEITNNMINVVPELARTASTPGSLSRSSIPYPTFSKAHSKETVSLGDDISTTTAPPTNPTPSPTPAQGLYTPKPSNIQSSEATHTHEETVIPAVIAQQETAKRPPSPPDTVSSDLDNLKHSNSSKRSTTTRAFTPEPSRTTSGSSIKSWFTRSKDKMHGAQEPRSSKEYKSLPASQLRGSGLAEHEKYANDSETSDEESSTINPHATANPPSFDRSTKPRIIPPGLDADDSPDSHQTSSPRTPIPNTLGFPVAHYRHPLATYPDLATAKYGSSVPPPPPPQSLPSEIPRVDYLLQYGGLTRPVPGSLMGVASAYSTQPFPNMKTTAPPEFERVFGPFSNLLDQFNSVISRNGSVAVATGYRSVARRLLDRLEHVFARDLPSDGCSCVMCDRSDGRLDSAPGWGDILEFVCGRRQVPEWPALHFVDKESGPGYPNHIATSRPGSPAQIDPDIAEEFHQHYLRQSKKTKASVDKWLSSTAGDIAAPPPDIDDETLTFTILTRLQEAERPLYSALLSGTRSLAVPRPVTLGIKARADLVVRAGLAIQRLYRLHSLPRDPEVCVYLVRNPDFHNLMISLSEINNSEWEILVSGRFDGFLWSGADAQISPAYPAQTWEVTDESIQKATAGLPSSLSRTGTPVSTRGAIASPTYDTNRQAVSYDEDAEIAALAALELRIFQDMEQLEDAFEGLHRKAEVVRTALRNRGAGLAMSAQRRSAGAEGVHTRLNTPGLGERGWNGDTQTEVDVESDWDDGASEIAPHDSASQISSSRHRRPKRRVERRTPALVEEEEEEE